MRLVDVYTDDRAPGILWRLLQEREPSASISHKAMPTPEEHAWFYASRPYMHWYLVEDGYIRGACYLSKQREIGIAILRGHRGVGYGEQAVRLLMQTHPGKFLANVNPKNEASVRLFKTLGFEILQHTYALEAT